MAKRSKIDDPQVDFLVLSILNAIEDLLREKCADLSKREHSSLERKIKKAVEQFVAARR